MMTHGPRPRDWTRFEREMRVWGRKFERDMHGLGEELEQGFAGAGRSAPRGCHAGVWAWDFDRDARRSARRAARGAARRAAHRAAEAAARTTAHAVHTAERAAMRAKWRSGACGWGRHGGIWAWWWLAIPVFFMSRGWFEDAGSWSGLGAGAQELASGWLAFVPIAPVARLFAQAVGVTYAEAFALLALSAAVTAAAAWLGWRTGRPRSLDPRDPARR
jgi:hypothetical protein